jgi:hypothetical protein
LLRLMPRTAALREPRVDSGLRPSDFRVRISGFLGFRGPPITTENNRMMIWVKTIIGWLVLISPVREDRPWNGSPPG